jgi:hypothetical protein
MLPQQTAYSMPKITAEMVDRAAAALRRHQYPARFDPRPWRELSAANKRRWIAMARPAIRAALKLES